MPSVFLRTLALMLATAVFACSSGPRGRPSADPDVIERYQILGGPYANAHDVVRALRPQWLIRRSGGNRNNSTAPIWVFVDNNRYGDLNQLRNVAANSIGSIRRVDGITATTRWGSGYTEGVLYILTYVPARSDTTAN